MNSLNHISLRSNREQDARHGFRDVGVTCAWRLLSALVVTLVLACLFSPAASAAEKVDVGKNVGSLLKGYAGEVYGGMVAACSLVFLWNRRYVELATFLFAAVVVAWMVFAPEEIGSAAEAIGKQIFG
jgi:hypothetical protein